jgi:hypothetical protein
LSGRTVQYMPTTRQPLRFCKVHDWVFHSPHTGEI